MQKNEVTDIIWTMDKDDQYITIIMKKPQVWALAFILILGLSAAFLLRSEKNDVGLLEQAASSWNIFSNSSDVDSGRIITNIEAAGGTDGSDDVLEGIRYVNAAYGFSLVHPKNMVITTFGEDLGETILVQENEGTKSFQIFVMPWDEPEFAVITPERIKQDLPDFDVIEPKEAVLADGTHALLFWSDEEGSGKTREVWIIHGDYLYEITALADLDSLLARVMGTWTFE